MFYIIERTLSSDIHEMKQFLDETIMHLKDKLGEDYLFDTKLILDELIVNGIVHGNDYNCNKKVKVFIGVCDRRIRIEVSDEGIGINYNKDEVDPSELTCGGRGLFIVDALSDEFIIDKNKVISVKHRNS